MANRNSPHKHALRARIVLLTADGLGTNAIMTEGIEPRRIYRNFGDLVRPWALGKLAATVREISSFRS